MMKKHKGIKLCGILLVLLCFFCANKPSSMQVYAEESQPYEWQSVECISIAPPTKHPLYGNVAFQVNFNKEVTNVNYKHLAAGATVLNTFGKYDKPNMTDGTIKSLDESGVFDSMNDCIAFNGKKVREIQKISPLACMIHVGELGANNSMCIEFTGDIESVAITDLNDDFTFTFYEGLKFPSGVEIKETVTWKYNPATQAFSQVPNETNPSDANFSVYYNGQKVTKENNLVTIYDKQAFSIDNFYVFTSDVFATVEIQPQFETLADGYNYVIIVCKSANNVYIQRMQVVFDLQQYAEPTQMNKWVKITLWVGIPIVTLSAITVPTVMILAKKRRKKRVCEEENV